MVADIKTFSFSFEELSLTVARVASSLGYAKGEAPAPVVHMIEEVLNAAGGYCNIIGGFRILREVIPGDDDTELQFGGKAFATGNIIAAQMRKAERMAVFVCTAGNDINEWSRQLFKKGNELKGYIVDAVASETVEKAMDKLQSALCEEMEEKGLRITNRYSPGYCGWTVSEQHLLFSLLPEGFCGVSLTDSALMVPIKSVSGIVGIGSRVSKSGYKCNLCDMENCIYRTRKKLKDEIR
jgi:hypothetical protein